MTGPTRREPGPTNGPLSGHLWRVAGCTPIVWGMRISDVVRHKGGDVITVRSDASVTALLSLLSEHRIGAVVVSDDGESVHGIVSERDIVRHLHTDGAALLDAPVSQIMTVDVHTCVPEDSLDDLESAMTERRFRHVPVLVDGKLSAIVSIGDVVKNRIGDLQAERDQLRDYIQS
jgi:CBS domain-containing protein